MLQKEQILSSLFFIQTNQQIDQMLVQQLAKQVPIVEKSANQLHVQSGDRHQFQSHDLQVLNRTETKGIRDRNGIRNGTAMVALISHGTEVVALNGHGIRLISHGTGVVALISHGTEVVALLSHGTAMVALISHGTEVVALISHGTAMVALISHGTSLAVLGLVVDGDFHVQHCAHSRVFVNTSMTTKEGSIMQWPLPVARWYGQIGGDRSAWPSARFLRLPYRRCQ